MIDASDSRPVRDRRQRTREDRAKRAEQALEIYMENDRDLRTALIDLFVDAAHLAARNDALLDEAWFVQVIRDAMWCVGHEEDPN